VIRRHQFLFLALVPNLFGEQDVLADLISQLQKDIRLPYVWECLESRDNGPLFVHGKFHDSWQNILNGSGRN